MPYKVKVKGDQFCVVKDDGKQVACHDTRPKALAQLKALYANEKADLASSGRVPCTDSACWRAFLSFDSMLEHSDRVHGTDDAKAFSNEKRQKMAQKGKAIPGKGGGSFPIESVQDLKNAIKAYGRAGNKAAAKAHIIRHAKRLKATNLLPKGWQAQDKAQLVTCPDCEDRDLASARSFTDEDGLAEHAEAVHTFSDIESLVQEAVREKYYKPGNYKASPPVASVWAWTRDIAQDWVVFVVETEGDSDLFKASYSITDGAVTLGDPVKVKRRTVYDEIKEDD